METKGKNWYDKNYKRLMFIPIAVLVLSIGYLISFNSQNGDIIHKDVSITGGTTVVVFDRGVSVSDLEIFLSEKFDDMRIRTLSEFGTGEQKGFYVETQADSDEILSALEDYLGYTLNQENSSVEFSGASLSEGFYQQLRFSIILAFLFMAVVVFITFRSFIPSLAVILSALADIVMTVAIVDLFGMRLSIAGVIAFLMLIGYSVDTDILLTTRLLRKREGGVNERIMSSFKTGLTMTLTSMAAIAVSLSIIYGVSEVLRQIFTILLIGLGFDIFNTWFMNASLLKWYVESKPGGGQ
jgi:preprotein translocase subunit SecF